MVINLLLLLPLYCLSQKAVFEEVALYTKDNEIELLGALIHVDTKNPMPFTPFVHGSAPIYRNGIQSPITEILVEQLTKQDTALGSLTAGHTKELAQTHTRISYNTFLLSLFFPKNRKLIKNWISFDPFKKIERLKLPKLVVNRNMDVQISEKEALVLQIARPSSILKMNHVIKTRVSLGTNLKSYLNPNFVISQYLIDAITSVIKNNE